ncbi:MAG: DUF488 family protein [Desulfurococcaceae archaeon]
MDKIAYTIGYGGRTVDEFIGILLYFNINKVIDVRRWNKSKRLQDFSGNTLREHLSKYGIDYIWIPELGGYRKFGVDVEDRGIASCFESEGFRAYATYLTTRSDVKEILRIMVKHLMQSTGVIMCKERYPWMCHRKILSDYLVAVGFKVIHIISEDKFFEHRLHNCAIVKNGVLYYR